MNKKFFYSLPIIAVAFALVLGLGVISNTKAGDSYNESYPGQVDLFGVDEAHNGIRSLDADRDKSPEVNFETRGLQGEGSGGM